MNHVGHELLQHLQKAEQTVKEAGLRVWLGSLYLMVPSENSSWGSTETETEPLLETLKTAGFQVDKVEKDTFYHTQKMVHPDLNIWVHVRYVPDRKSALEGLMEEQERLQKEIERVQAEISQNEGIA